MNYAGVKLKDKNMNTVIIPTNVTVFIKKDGNKRISFFIKGEGRKFLEYKTIERRNKAIDSLKKVAKGIDSVFRFVDEKVIFI